MKKLLTFETFVPKNIEKRQIDLDKINAEKLIKFKNYEEKFKV